MRNSKQLHKEHSILLAASSEVIILFHIIQTDIKLRQLIQRQ